MSKNMLASDKEVAVLEKKIAPVVSDAIKIVIKNEADMKAATVTLSEVNKYLDQVVEKEEQITKPLNAAVKAARALFKPLKSKLEEAVEAVRDAMTVYQTEKVRLAEEEEKKIAGRIGSGKGKLQIETAVKKLSEVDRPADSISTESGSVTFITVEKFEVMDMTLLPIEYHLADEIKIRSAMKAGIKVDGVRYYTEQVPRNNR